MNMLANRVQKELIQLDMSLSIEEDCADRSGYLGI